MTATATTTSPSDATMTRAYVTHKPQWQSLQTPLMAPSHQVAAVANKKKEVVHPYQRQYAHVYHQRYHQLSALCWKAVDEKSQQQQDEVHVTRLLELTEKQKSVVVGTLVKESVPDDTASPVLAEGSECRASDALFLEDDSGRVALEWKDKHAWPTGAVVAVRGVVGTDGVLQVQDIICPYTNTKPAASPPPPPAEPSYVLLLSGLETGNPAVPPTARDMLLSFVQGRLAHPAAARVARILICGGWTASPTKEALQEADAWLDQILAAGIPCDVLPGQNDPTTANWPQRPLHRALMPRSSRHTGLLYRTPNPYRAVYQDNTVVMATDGLNVRAQQRVTCVPVDHHPNDNSGDGDAPMAWQSPSVLQVMQQHLDGRHVCPVGPSEVPTAPHADLDPMVVVPPVHSDDDDRTHWPRLYATGGHSAFATALAPQGTRLVAVPSFGHTGTAVLVELSSLQVHLLRFVDETV